MHIAGIGFARSVERPAGAADADGSPAPPGAAGRDRALTLVALVGALAVVGWAAADRAAVSAAGPLLAVAGIVLGIPHGAVDHLVPGRAAARWSTPRRLVAVLAVYVAAASVAAAALLLAADVSFAVFLVVSAAHFGWAETTFAAERRGAPVPRPRRGGWGAIAHGVVVVALPLWSADGRDVLLPLVPRLVEQTARIPTSSVVVGVTAVCAVTVAGLLARRRWTEAAELSLLLLLFLVVPPLAAFGVYFGTWHAARHTRRLMRELAPGLPAAAQFRAFTRAAALPSVAALGVLGLLWWWSRDDDAVLVTGVSVLLALTFPHVVAVAVLDRHRRAGQPV